MCVLSDCTSIKLKIDTKHIFSKYRLTEIKQLITEELMGQRRNQGRNKISVIK